MKLSNVLMVIWVVAGLSALSVLLAPSPKIAPLGPLAVAMGATLLFAVICLGSHESP